jgi:hypothetical protein
VITIFHQGAKPDTGPDPAFQMNPDPDPIRIQGFDDQKLKKKMPRKIILFKNCCLLMSKLQEKTLDLKEDIQHFKN